MIVQGLGWIGEWGVAVAGVKSVSTPDVLAGIVRSVDRIDAEGLAGSFVVSNGHILRWLIPLTVS
jgi:hypothetical protein